MVGAPFLTYRLVWFSWRLYHDQTLDGRLSTFHSARHARVVKLVDTDDLKSSGLCRVGSSPSSGIFSLSNGVFLSREYASDCSPPGRWPHPGNS